MAVDTPVVVVLLGLSGYLFATWRLRRRADRWPVTRTVSCVAGGSCLLGAALIPVPAPPFTGHMIGHTLVGMAAPVLVALARPVTLALRALPPGPARRAVLRVFHSRLAGALVFPPLAAVSDVGGLWVFYRTGLFDAVHENTVLHALVNVHFFAAGLLFAVAATQLEPVTRQYSFVLRAASLVLAAAAHDVLAKSLYAAPPLGIAAMFDADDVQSGAQVMYYGGDVTEIMLAVVIAGQWYFAAGRAHARARRARLPSGAPPRDSTLNPG